MNKKVNIHIGLEKTGTTAIQNFLKENKKLLEDVYKISVPSWQNSGSKNTHHQIAKTFIPKQNMVPWHKPLKIEYFEEILNQFQTSNNFSQLIISSELFSYSSEKEIKRLHQILINFNVNIILFLRRQDEYLDSLYNQHIKRIWSLGRKPISMDQFILDKELNFYKFISKWTTNGFTKIDLKTYRSSKSKDFIFRQFFENINTDIVNDNEIIINQRVSNPSLSLFHSTLMMDFVPKIQDSEFRRKISDLIFKHNNTSYTKYKDVIPYVKNYFSLDYKIKLLSECKESNDKVLKLFPDSGYNKTSLFRPLLTQNLKSFKIDDLTNNEVFDLFFDLLIYGSKNNEQ